MRDRPMKARASALARSSRPSRQRWPQASGGQERGHRRAATAPRSARLFRRRHGGPRRSARRAATRRARTSSNASRRPGCSRLAPAYEQPFTFTAGRGGQTGRAQGRRMSSAASRVTTLARSLHRHHGPLRPHRRAQRRSGQRRRRQRFRAPRRCSRWRSTSRRTARPIR